jgi:hypothetical protein
MARRDGSMRMPSHKGDGGLGEELAALPNFSELFVQISRLRCVSSQSDHKFVGAWACAIHEVVNVLARNGVRVDFRS